MIAIKHELQNAPHRYPSAGEVAGKHADCAGWDAGYWKELEGFVRRLMGGAGCSDLNCAGSTWDCFAFLRIAQGPLRIH